MELSASFLKYVHQQGLERKARKEELLQTCYALWAIPSIFAWWVFVGFFSDLLSYSAGAIHLSAPAVDNVLFSDAGMYGDGHNLGSHAVTQLVSVPHSTTPCDDRDRDLRRQDAYGVNIPALLEAARTKHMAETAEVAEGGDEGEEGREGKDVEEKEGDEEEMKEGPPEEEAIQSQGTKSLDITSDTSEDLEGDKVVGGALEEDEEENKTGDRMDKLESGAEQKAATETGDKHGVLPPQQGTSTDTTPPAHFEGSHQTTGDEMATKGKAEQGIQYESVNGRGHEKGGGLDAPSSGAQNRDDGEEKTGKESNAREQNEQPAQLLSTPGSTLHKREETNTDVEQFRVQFSFKPDVIIPSVLRPTVHYREVVDNSGRKWFEIASLTKPELLKLEGDDTSTIYHHPGVNYA